MSNPGADSVMDGEGKMPSCNGRESKMLSGHGRGEAFPGPGAERSRGKVGQYQEIVWRNVILMTLLHAGAMYSLLLIPKSRLLTLIWGKVIRWFGFLPQGLVWVGPLWRRVVWSAGVSFKPLSLIPRED